MAEKTKIFLDTNVILTGLKSKRGNSAQILKLCEKGKYKAIISDQVLEEIVRNVAENKYFSALLPNYKKRMRKLNPIVIKDPAFTTVEKWSKVIDIYDASIFAAAHLAKVDYFITWNVRHFRKPQVPIPVYNPYEFLFEQAIKEQFGK